MDKWLKLHIFKTFLNIFVRVAVLAVPYSEPTYPQTKIVKNIFSQMSTAYDVEAFSGRFDDKPYKNPSLSEDKNFFRLLKLAEKVSIYIGEIDCYYRMWLGLSLVLARKEAESFEKSLHLEGFFSEVERQWLVNMHGAFREEYFMENRRAFSELILANFLQNITDSHSLPKFVIEGLRQK